VKQETAGPLPKTLPGAVCAQWVRCGRPGCRCARGALHGPYFYRFWRDAGRLRKQYIRRPDVDRVRAQCQARRQGRQQLAAGWALWRGMTAFVREVEQSCNR
jgi:hypothetical protein